MKTIKNKSVRTKVFTAVSVVSILLVLILNLILAGLLQSGAYYVDMTPEGFYTLSEEMIDECAFLGDDDFVDANGNKREITITFCTDPDYIIESPELRYIYFMALDLNKVYSNVKVKYVNAKMNPTAVMQYKPTSLSEINETNVIVSEGGRYRVSSASRFWATGTSYDDDVFFNGEYQLASLIKSVTLINQPKAYFVTGHGESIYNVKEPESEMSLRMSDFYDLLRERGLNVDVLDLSTVERIPDDCALLIINNPTKDFEYDKNSLNSLSYVSDIEKLDRYLTMKQGAIMIAKGYETTLPNFETFLYEWGFDFSPYKVRDGEKGENEIVSSTQEGSVIVAEYDTREESYGYAIYGEFADLSSAPRTAFGDTGVISCSFNESTAKNEPGTGNVSRNYVSFLTTSANAMVYAKNEDGEYEDPAEPEPSVYDLAALSIRSGFNSYTGETLYSYMFCTAGAGFFENAVLGNESYANFEIMSALVDNISRVDEYADISLGGSSLNSSKFGGKRLIPVYMKEDGLSAQDYVIYSNTYDPEAPQTLLVLKELIGLSNGAVIAYTALIAAVPLAVLVLGIVVRIRRRYL